MLKVADNITEAADWINARRNVKIMFFDRADFREARREIKAAEKPAERRIPAGNRASAKCSGEDRQKERCRRFRPDGRRAAHRLRPLGLGLLLQPAEDRPTYLRFTADDKDSGSHAEIITNRHGEGRWLRDSTTGDYIQISGTSQYRLPRTKNALECQLASV